MSKRCSKRFEMYYEMKYHNNNKIFLQKKISTKIFRPSLEGVQNKKTILLFYFVFKAILSNFYIFSHLYLYSIFGK